MDSRPYSPHFNEHYWTGGAAEKTYVFIEGNNLPQRFAQAQTFTVAELGFGTGLNFLLTANVWQQNALPTSQLTYISYEQFPLPAQSIAQLHATHPHSQQLLNSYQPQPGWNIWPLTPTITLKLYVGDALHGLPTQTEVADAWYLDGFSPAKNPQLWSEAITELVAEKCRNGTTASTYSAAGIVKKNLENAGFCLTRMAGFPPKRHMLTAVYLK